MCESLKSLLALFDERKGQFFITRYCIVSRLVGIGTDEHDYFLIYWNGREITYDSPLCPQIPLKGKIDNEHYNELVRIAKLNDKYLIADPLAKSRITKDVEEYILQVKDQGLFTEIYLDIH